MTERAVRHLDVTGDGICTISIHTRPGWIPPGELATMTSDEIEAFLGFAPVYVRWLREKQAGVSMDGYTEMLQRQLEDSERRLKGEADAAIARKNAELDVVIARKNAELDVVIARKNAELAAASTMLESLRGQLGELQADRADLEEKVRGGVVQLYDSIVSTKDGVIQFLKDELARRDERLHRTIRTEQNAAVRGRAGEDSFEDMAASVGWLVTRTAGESHMCDFKACVAGVDVFFEIKNHADTIPSKEITKFRRDMKEHPEVGAGVFVGMLAPIPRSNGERWVLEWTDDKRPMIFIGELEKDDPCSVLNIVEKMLRICAVLRTLHTEVAADTLRHTLESRIQRANDFLASCGEKLRVLYNKLVVDKSAAESAYMMSLSMLKSIREEHGHVVDALIGELTFSEDVGCAAAAPAAAPKPRKSRKKAADAAAASSMPI